MTSAPVGSRTDGRDLTRRACTDEMQRDACRTRSRLFSAAVHLFSKQAYSDVGVRAIAKEAGVDPALVCRYFGGKKELFAAAVEEACAAAPWFSSTGVSVQLPEQLLELAVGSRSDIALSTLLRSSHHPETSAIVQAAIRRHLIEPIAARLSGPGARERAELVCGLIIGAAFLLQAGPDQRDFVRARLLANSLRFLIEAA